MVYKCMFAGDLHKRMKDITTIRGYVDVNLKVQNKLIKLIGELGITHFFEIGDWFDGGYGSDVSAALAHTDIDRELADAVNGNFYGVIGNHIRKNMDSNPELHLIQPHHYYTSRHSIARKEQVIKTPDTLMLNGVKIYLQHHNKFAESAADYKPIIDPSSKYNIALFHTEYIVPTVQLNKMGMSHVINENSKIAYALEGVDLAIVGHLHKPLGQFPIRKSDGSVTTMIVPGSLTNTDSGMISRHNAIDIPIVTISEEGSVTIEFYHFDLLTNELAFQTKEFSSSQKRNLQSLRGNNKTTLYEELEQQTWIGEKMEAFTSLNAFIKAQGYTETDKRMIKSILDAPEDVASLIRMYKAETQTAEL